MRNVIAPTVTGLVLLGASLVDPASGQGDSPLAALFRKWRSFQAPTLRNGVPDYSASAMFAQHQGLAAYQRLLAGMDPGRWPIPQQVDYHIVRAEMNGLDFDHRVLRPWASNPAFYVTVFTSESDQPAREGPHADAAVEVWTYAFPLSEQDARKMDTGLRVLPPLLQQARANLTGKGQDLWTYGTRAVRQQSADLFELAAKVKDEP